MDKRFATVEASIEGAMNKRFDLLDRRLDATERSISCHGTACCRVRGGARGAQGRRLTVFPAPLPHPAVWQR